MKVHCLQCKYLIKALLMYTIIIRRTMIINSVPNTFNCQCLSYVYPLFSRYSQFQHLKKKNPSLKTLLAVGGWNAGSALFSNMVNNDNSRLAFVKQATSFLRTYKFDGFDLDWEYPAKREGSRSSDRQQFIVLIDVSNINFAQTN